MSRSGFGFRVSCVRVRGVVRGYSGLGWSEVCGVWCVVLARLWRVYMNDPPASEASREVANLT